MKRVMLLISVVALLLTGLVVVADMESEHPSDQPLKFPADMGYVPFHFYDSEHQPQGYTIDLMTEVARRLGRPGITVVDVNWSGIFAGLFSGKYELIMGGMYITDERAEMMDITEPIMSLFNGVAIRTEDADKVTCVEDLEGIKLGVPTGSQQDEWATANQSKYGFEVTRFDKSADGVLALRTKKVDAYMASTPTVRVFVDDEPTLVAAPFVLQPASTGWGVLNTLGTGAGFRKGDPYRYEVEKVIEGMKLDGTLQKIFAKWVTKPAPGNYCNIVFPGYGTPGIRAYEPEAYHIPIFAPE